MRCCWPISRNSEKLVSELLYNHSSNEDSFLELFGGNGTHPFNNLRRPPRNQWAVVSNLRRTWRCLALLLTPLAVTRVADRAQCSGSATKPIRIPAGRGAKSCEAGIAPPLIARGRNRGPEVVRLRFEVRLVSVGRAWARLRVLQVLAVTVGLIFWSFRDIGGNLRRD